MFDFAPRRFVRLLSALLVLACGAALPRTAMAQDILDARQTSIHLNVGEAKFIRLDQTATAVFLSSPQIADVDLQTARYVYVVGKAIGATDLYVLGPDDKPLVQAKVTVDIDLPRLQDAVARSLTSGSVKLSTSNGAIFLNGTVDTDTDAQAAENIVTKLAGNAAVVVNNIKLSTPPQVNLQVTIAEVSRTIEEDLGISLTASSKSGNRTFTPPSSTASGFQVGATMGSNLNLVMNALAQTGLATILSQPNLTARSGEKATFLVGGRVPFRVGATQDDTRVEFQPIGVELNFMPSVLDRDQIQIQLDTRVRELDSSLSNDSGQGISERSASTTVELGSGQSFAIAGIFKSNRQQSLTEFPGLGKLPIIGALFRSSAYQRGETELVIIVTPYVVRPTTRDQLRTPVDGLNPTPNGIQQMATGKLFQPGSKTSATGAQSRAGFLISR